MERGAIDVATYHRAGRSYCNRGAAHRSRRVRELKPYDKQYWPPHLEVT